MTSTYFVLHVRQSKAEKLAWDAASEDRSMSRSSALGAAYRKFLSTGHLEPNTGQLTLVNQLEHLQERLWARESFRAPESHSSQNGFYIYGGVGTGKTKIADLFAATLPASVTHRRAHFFEFMTDVHLRLHRARSEAHYSGDPLINIGRKIHSESSVLCLDEFQVSDIADAMILKRLFGSFWDSGGIIISTSNRHPTDLYKNGLNRPLFLPFIEELQRKCVVFKMEGDRDYRMASTEDQGRRCVFFTDACEFEASLLEATGGGHLQPREIAVVMNRKFKVNALEVTDSRLVVAATFGELCDVSLGAADYHALCHASGTIYLSGLREFAADELDVVRRFITLIDVAYELRTRVVCLSTVSLFETFKNIAASELLNKPASASEPRDSSVEQNMRVRREGGSSSSMMSTFINDVEWSATGLRKASLATGGAGETDVRFAIGRAISRLSEMSSMRYGESA